MAEPLDGPSNAGGAMSPGSLVVMLLVLTIVWGGLILMLVIALRREREKSRDEIESRH